MTFRTRIFLALTSVAIVPNIGAAIISEHASHASLEAQEARTSLELVHSVRTRVMEYLDNEVARVRVRARHFDDDDHWSDFETKNLQYIAMVSADGQILAASKQGLRGQDVGFDWARARARADRSVPFGDPELDTRTGTYVLPITIARTANDGYVVASLPWDVVADLTRTQPIRGEQQDARAHIMLTDRSGMVLSCFVRSEMFHDNLIDLGMSSPRLAALAQEGTVFEARSEHGTDTVATYAPVAPNAETQWSLLLYQDPDTLYGPVQALRRVFLATGGVTAVLVLVFAMLWANWFSRPIFAIRDAARAVGDGRFDVRLPEGSDELGQLGFAFNGMISRLVQSNEDREVMSKRLVQSSKLAALGTLAAGVAHEINNPLAIIRMNVDLLSMDLAQLGKLSPDLESSIADQTSAIERITEIVRRLLAYARTDSSPNAAQTSDLHEVITDTVALSTAIGGRDAVAVERRLQSTSPHIVGSVGDAQQILLNLLVNARDALLDTDGRRLIEVETTDEEDWVVCRVKDNGSGIPAHLLPRIFDPFFTTKPPGKGTGLGLALVVSALESMGGHLEVSSEPAVGTCFTLKFKRAAPDAPLATHVVEAPRARASGKVLLVDDEPDLRRALRRQLESAGYEVTEAADGRAALALLTAARFDIVLTDIKMPGMSGDQLLQEARGLGGKFYVMTAGATELTLEEGERIHKYADGFLHKPFSPERMLALLASAPRTAGAKD